MDFDLSEKGKGYREKLIRFMEEHIYPIEHEVNQFYVKNVGKMHPSQELLKTKAKEAGLWNLFLPLSYGKYSCGLTYVEYAVLAEEMGKVHWSSEIFNCNAPDTNSMEVMANYGSAEQKKKYDDLVGEQIN